MAVIMMFVALVWTTLSQGHPTNIWVLKRPMASRGMLPSKLVDFFRAPTHTSEALSWCTVQGADSLFAQAILASNARDVSIVTVTFEEAGDEDDDGNLLQD